MKLSIIVAFLMIAACSAKPASEEAGTGCSVPEVNIYLNSLCPSLILNFQDCVGEMLWCDTEAGECKYGCDEQEDCPEGKICVIANHACQC